MTNLRTNDARNRALRTFLQGLTTDVAAALILLLLPVFTNANGWGDFEWQVLSFLMLKTVAVTGLSYVMRQYLDRSSLPTPLPPSDPGEPDVEVAPKPILGKAFTGGTFSAAEEDARRDGDPHRP